MKYYVDGWTMKCNPSPYGGGYTLANEIGEILEIGFKAEKKFTNNEAELMAIYNALKRARRFDEIITDSNTAMCWVFKNSYWRVPSTKPTARPDLENIMKECGRMVIEKMVKITFQPREYNKAGIFNEENPSELNGLIVHSCPKSKEWYKKVLDKDIDL